MGLIQTARRMAAHTLSVVPAGPDKRPLGQWKEFQNRIMNPVEIEQNFKGADRMGIICGAVSGNLEVIDIDLKYDLSGDIFVRYRKLIDEWDEDLFFLLTSQKTVSGGIHLMYRCEEIQKNQKLARRPTTEAERQANPSDKARVLIETRGEGGFIMCAPSEGYRLMWKHEFENVKTITPDQRRILLDAARSLNEYFEPEPPARKHSNGPVDAAGGGGWDLSPGDDFDARGDLVGLMERHGWKVVGQMGDVTQLLRPGETTSGYSANWNHIPGRFWCWSTSTMFNPETLYKPYAVYAMLECGGDFREAAKKLLSEGYGKSKPLPAGQASKTREVPAQARPEGLHAVYIRVGTTYYKRIETTDVYGNQIPKLVKWKKEEILLDHGKDFLKEIPKFDSFIMRPSHTDYQSEIGTSYNIYNPITHEPVKGDCPNTERFIAHVFGDKATIFWDYLTILWRYPTHLLPVVCLVSQKRQTGKTTVFKLLRAIFQANAVILKNENFQTQFNAHFVGKLLLMVDESHVGPEKNKESERIKSMATSDTDFLQYKGKDSEQVDYYAKILMTANNKEFIKIDKEETRYMVVEVPPFDKHDPDLLDKMVSEIPALLYLLHTREIHHPREDRAWFRPELLESQTLTDVMNNTKLGYEKLIDDYLTEAFEFFDRDYLEMTVTDLYEELKDKYRFLDLVKVRQYIKSFGYKPEKLQRYSFLSLNLSRLGGENVEGIGFISGQARVGRPFKILRKLH